MTTNSRSPLILAGDVGGTKTRLGIFRTTGGGVHLLHERDFPSRSYHGLSKIIEEFMAGRESIQAACFGVAGPVIGGAVVTTNLPWTVSEKNLKKELGITKIGLLNDLVANAWGVEVMKRTDFAVLNRGRKTKGNRALLSAGTGLGAAVLFWNGKRHVPSPSEGGHVEFGPTNRLELELLQYLFDRYGHVSYERILSGAGLVGIYDFLKERGTHGKEPRWLSEERRREDPAAVITENARLGKSRLCEAAVDLYASIYGAAAGNLALQVMAVEGVFIGGGIAPKIIWKMMDGTFMKAFKDKGRLSPIVERIPVKVIMNDRAALLGAAAYAGSLRAGK